MSQKTLFIIFFVALLGIAGFFLAAFFISRVEEKPLGEVLRNVSPFGDVVGDIITGVLPPAEESDRGGVEPSDTAARSGERPKLYKISAEPVSGAAAFTRGGTEYVRYVLLETGLAGVPIVATNVGGVQDLIENNMGILVPPRNPEKISLAIKKIIDSPDATEQSSNRLKEKILHSYTQKNMRDMTVRIYK